MTFSGRDVSLDLAQRMCEAAIDAARRDDSLVSAAVVDAGGHLIAFARMDGAEIAGPIIAPDKAFTAVANRISTRQLGELTGPGGEFAGYHSAAGGRFVCFGGGVPLFDGERAAGAIGVSGASAEQDDAYARVAAELWDQAGN